MAKRHEPHRTKNTLQLYSELEPYLVLAFRAEAIASGMRMREALEEAMRDWLRKKRKISEKKS